MSKIYILDTNVLLHDPKSLFAFEENEVVIPLVVLDELDKKKVGHDETAKHARMVIRSLDKLRLSGGIHKGAHTPAGGLIRVELNYRNHSVPDLDQSRADNRLISVALGLKSEHPDRKVALITKDINLRVKCDALGVVTDDYNADSVAENASSIYEGTKEILVPSQAIDDLYRDECIAADGYGEFYENQYVFMKSTTRQQHTSLARFSKNTFVKLEVPSNVWGISSRNKEQAFALDALFNPNIKLITMIGKAGSGKTLLAAAAGIAQVLDSHEYRKLILTRPVQPLGRDIGFLPGDINEKMRPWMAPLQDNLDLLFSEKGSNYLDMQRDSGIVEVEALTYIRGRSIPRSYIIVDECLVAGHQISMANGTLKPIEDITAGDVVLSLDMENNTSKPGVVGGLISRMADKILDIKTSMTTIRCTKNHPMYIFRDFVYEKKEAQYIKVGDFIPSPKFVPHEQSNDISANLAYFVGMIISDGHIEKGYRTIKVATKKDTEHFNKMFALGASELGCKDCVKIGTNKRGDNIIRLNRKSIISDFSNKFQIPPGNKSGVIKVPDEIFKSSLKCVRSFLSACFDAEGDINITKSGSLVINYSSVSKEMVIGVQHLLKKFGISSSVYFDIKRKVNNKTRYIHRVCLTGRSAYDFHNMVGFVMVRKQDILDTHFMSHCPLDMSRIPVADILRKRLKLAGIKRRNPMFANIANSKTIYRYMINERYADMFSKKELDFINTYDFTEVKSIDESDKNSMVYDFKVNGYGTFCVNGIISSNCQNLTLHEIKTVITRVGEGSKVVLTGDILQIDNPFIDSVDNGLSCIVEKFKDQPMAAHITLQKGERSELATMAAEIL